jgi:plasmid stabilization system protein ParE
MSLSKSYRVELLRDAQCDIEGIALLHRSYVGIDSARKITDAIYDKLEVLESYPDIGFELPDRELRKAGYRGLILEPRYLCIYRRVESIVFVYHIVDARTDYPKLLKHLPSN